MALLRTPLARKGNKKRSMKGGNYENWLWSRETWPRVLFISSVGPSAWAVKEGLDGEVVTIGVTDTGSPSSMILLALPGNEASTASIAFFNSLAAAFIMQRKFGSLFLWYNRIRQSSRLLSFGQWLIYHKRGRLPLFRNLLGHPSFTTSFYEKAGRFLALDRDPMVELRPLLSHTGATPVPSFKSIYEKDVLDYMAFSNFMEKSISADSPNLRGWDWPTVFYHAATRQKAAFYSSWSLAHQQNRDHLFHRRGFFAKRIIAYNPRRHPSENEANMFFLAFLAQHHFLSGELLRKKLYRHYRYPRWLALAKPGRLV